MQVFGGHEPLTDQPHPLTGFVLGYIQYDDRVAWPTGLYEEVTAVDLARSHRVTIEL